METVLPDREAAALAHRRGENIIDPRPLRLTIGDLVLLDRAWSRNDQYHGTELIDGRIYHTPARFAPRGMVAAELSLAIHRRLEEIGSPLLGAMRASIAMPPYDLPLPDIVVTSEPGGPGFVPAHSVALVVEVAESALDFFLGAKLRSYARHGIPEYWVADVNARVIHQMWVPEGDAYAEGRERAFGERIAAATIEGLAVETAGI